MAAGEAYAGLDSALLRQLDTVRFCLKGAQNGRFGGNHPSGRVGTSVDWKDHVPYAQGDDLRRMDWKIAARLDKYYIRRTTDEQRLHHQVYVDMSASMGTEGKGRLAMQLAAALGYLAVHGQDVFSLKLLRGKACVPAADRILTEEALFHFAAASAAENFTGDTDLKAAVRRDVSSGGADGLSFLISDLLTDCDWQGVMKEWIARKRQAVLIQVLSPAEISPRDSGCFEWQSIEDEGDLFRVRADRSALKAYRKAYEVWQKEIGQFCRRNQIRQVLAVSNESATDILLKKAYRAEVIR